jgi:MioC protein
MFGLGDTFYEETYSQGSEHLDRRFAELGATRVGDYGRHDASSWDLPSDVALEWLPGVLGAEAKGS